jgi:hypothetical protein
MCYRREPITTQRAYCAREILHKADARHLFLQTSTSSTPMIPPIADDDPDPTTQMPWPAARTRHVETTDGNSNAQAEDGINRILVDEHAMKPVKVVPGNLKPRLTTWNLITLSISMAGAQVAWTVELGYEHRLTITDCDLSCVMQAMERRSYLA